MDESGYTFNWKADIKIQPYYVLSAVCFSSDKLPLAYQKIRAEISNLDLEREHHPLGQGFEIKARDIVRGSSYWKTHDDKRNAVRNIMLTAPVKYEGKAFVVVINKQAHQERYAYPDNPYMLPLKFILERLQMYLSDLDDHGICIYDQNKILKDDLQDVTTRLTRNGSKLYYYSPTFELFVKETFKLDKIIEFSFGRSENSIGLQVADFFASMTYAYVKNNKPSSCDWWKTLESSLHRKDGKLDGVGYKEFP